MENDHTTPELQQTEMHDAVQAANSLKDLLRADIENYPMTTYSWQMTPEKIEQNFHEVLSILDTEPTEVADCLSHLDRSYFVTRLSSRGVFTQGDIRAIANQLDAISLEKILTVNLAIGNGKVADDGKGNGLRGDRTSTFSASRDLLVQITGTSLPKEGAGVLVVDNYFA